MRMEEDGISKTGVLLNLTLEIIHLLTAEDCTIVKKTSGECITPSSHIRVSGGWSLDQIPITIHSPHSLDSNSKQKILELTKKIIELLTGEMDTDLYKDITMEDYQHLTSPEKSSERNPPERCPSPLYSQDRPEEDLAAGTDQDEDLIHIKVEVVEGEEEKYLVGDHQCKEEEIPEDISPDAQKIWNPPKELNVSTGDYELESKDLTQVSSRAELMTQKLSSVLSSESPSREQSYSKSGSLTGSISGGRRVYVCAECDKCFHNSANLSRHLRIHTGLKPFSCCECGKCFTHKSMLEAHQRIHTGEKPFTCSECGRCFTQKSHLVKHQVIHTGEKPFLCSECGKCFMQKSDLLKHVKVHTGEKPFACSQCRRRFASNLDLVNHQRMHTGERPFPCFECGKCFTQKSILVNHIKIHTGERPFQCPDCSKRFAQKSKLLGHQRTHTGEKPYSCSDCGKFFGHKSSLVKHCQRAHVVRR